MKISTKGRYALRLMLDLAVHGGTEGEMIPVRRIAQRQDISDKYLEQIITQLSRAGYVRSFRGAQGGYLLAVPPEQITVGWLLRVMEGSLAPVACLEQEPNRCPRAETCTTLAVWRELQTAIESVVDGITLADLAKEDREKLPELLGKTKLGESRSKRTSLFIYKILKTG